MNSISTKKGNIFSKNFRLYDYHVYDYDQDQDQEQDQTQIKKDASVFYIQLFGIDSDGKTCSIIVTDFRPYFYVQVPENQRWNSFETNQFLSYIRGRIPLPMRDNIISATMEEKNKLYGFCNGKCSQFIKLTFSNMATFNRCKNIWYSNDSNGERKYNPIDWTPIINKKKGTSLLYLYESNIPPLLRFFHIHNISTTGWIQLKYKSEHKVMGKTTTCDYEYKTQSQYILPQPTMETPVPYKICSFDIEASSSHGDFPLPIKSYKRLIDQMVDIFDRTNGRYDTLQKKSNYLETMVLTAFGITHLHTNQRYNDVTGIDRIYYKKDGIVETDLLDIIYKLVHTQIQKTVSKKCNDRLRISDYLLSINCEGGEETNNCGEGEGEEEEDDDGEENDDNDEYTNINTNDEPEIQTTSLVNIFMDTTIKRDQRIQKIDKIFTSVLPEVEGDTVTFIGSTFITYGSSEPYLNHCVVVNTCSPVEGAVIESVSTEKECLLAWLRIIQKENPDVIIGYNIFGFDYPFLFQRAKELDCLEEFMQFSKLKDQLSILKNKEGEWELDKMQIRLASGEYNLHFPKMHGRIQQDCMIEYRRTLNMASYKLDDVASALLSDDIIEIDNTSNNNSILISKNLSGLHVGDFIHIDMTVFTTEQFIDDVTKKNKFRVVQILERMDGKPAKYKGIVISKINDETGQLDFTNKVIKWSMAKDDVSPKDIFRLTEGSADDRAIVAKYCIQDCNLVQQLFKKSDTMTGSIEMASLCSVPINFLILRGQSIKLMSYMSKKCRLKNILMPDLEKKIGDGGYDGAIVLPPKTGMYHTKPVSCLDYSSLYPSIEISNNLSQDTKVWSKEYNLQGKIIRIQGERNSNGDFIYDNLPNMKYITVEYPVYTYTRKTPTSKTAKKTLCGKMEVRWVLPRVLSVGEINPATQKMVVEGENVLERGVLPSVLQELLKARKDTRSKQKTESDAFMYNVLEQRQLAIKATANSFYGQCGSSISSFYDKNVAACTTSIGRKMIMYARKMVEQLYGDSLCETKSDGIVQTYAEYVYGDTDSVFFTLNLHDPVTKAPIVGKRALKITIELAQQVAETCSLFLVSPMELSYEKTLMYFVICSKKRYAGDLYETDENHKKCLKIMGMQLKKRDACGAMKDAYGECLKIFMGKYGDDSVENAGKVLHYLEKILEDMVKGDLSMDKLIISKSLRGYYANPESIGHKVLADRIGERDPGNKPKGGDRMNYIFIKPIIKKGKLQQDKKKVLVGDRIETPEFIEENKLEIDFEYYITNQLMKPIQQLLGLALEEIWKYKNQQYKIDNYKKELDTLRKMCGEDAELFVKKKDKLSSEYVKTILFNPFLQKIANKSQGLTAINDIFAPINKNITIKSQYSTFAIIPTQSAFPIDKKPRIIRKKTKL